MSAYRVIPAQDGWWCTTGGKAARLPAHAAIDGVLTEDALSALGQAGFLTPPRARAYAVTLLTTTTCNLGCTYCFQNVEQSTANPFAPVRIQRALLSHTQIERAAVFVRNQMQKLGFDAVTLMLFGGEPLLNVDGCLQALGVFRELNLTHAEMVTNALLLTVDTASQLEQAGLQLLQVTFDGGRDDHDQVRVDHAGRATYDKILRNVTAVAAKTSLRFSFRLNISHHNLHSIKSAIDDLAAAGAPASSNVSFALIDDYGLGYQNDVEHDAMLAQRFIDLAGRAFDLGFNVQPLGNPASNCPYCSGLGGTSGAVINADGVLYSCWATAGFTEWAVGDTAVGYSPTAEIANKWVACNANARPHGNPGATRRFYDKVDSFVLERRYPTTRSGVA